jgi:HEAT repeat protein
MSKWRTYLSLRQIRVAGSLVDFLNDLTGGDDALAEAAAQSLSGLPEEGQFAALTALRALLASPEVDRRWWAVRSLAEPHLSHTQCLLAPALNDPDPSVRQCAALGMRLQIKRTPSWNPTPETIDSLLQALLERLKDADPLTARLAADALAAIGEPVVQQLLALLDGSNRAVKLLVVRSLAEIGDQRAIPALLAALDEDSLLMEYWANEGLEKMGVGMTYFFP